MTFIKGVDVSLLHELEKEHGAVYRCEGQERDIFQILKNAGINLVRLRLWHDPYTAEGVPYGGGTNDFATTKLLARRAVDCGMMFMLNFHYSDFWCDPAKQFKPKAWQGLGLEPLKKAVYEYTKTVLKELQNESLEPQYVQVGNEITNGFLWPEGHFENTENMAQLLEAGITAVRECNPNIKIILHLDFGTDNELYRKWFSSIEPYHLSFDMIGMSYYPFWNGGLDELKYNMADISARFNKEVIVVETAIGYTTDSLGCKGMIFDQELSEKTAYLPTEEGQAEYLEDLTEAIRSIPEERGKGFVYWEPEWLPIPACKWAQEAGMIYSRETGEAANSWANQALFDANGNANLFLQKKY